MYEKLRRAGEREVSALESRGENAAVPALEEIVPNWNKLSQLRLGVRQLEMDDIVGTVTSGRQSAFSPSFKPLLAVNTEFGQKWTTLYDAMVADGMRDPIKAYEYYNKYYVMEGNKRVSVMSSLEAVSIDAEVIRVIPAKEDSERYRAYQAFITFYNDTKIDRICFTEAASYTRLYALADKEPGVSKWTEDEITGLSSTFATFKAKYSKNHHDGGAMAPADAFLLWLKAYGYDACLAMMSTEIADSLEHMEVEFSVVRDNKESVMLDKPDDRRPGVLKQLLRGGPQHLRVAFLYNSTPENSGWTYWHELARQGLEMEFPGRVETTSRVVVDQDLADEAIDSLLDEGWDVIFATSPVFSEACMHQSMTHPHANILSCSLLASFYHVRSYYLRVYETKFIMGAIAGAMTENGRIGYIADYPILGTPASVNAFALGARMTNPRARILLEWSCVKGSDPENALLERGADIFSGRDISAPSIDSRAFGLYCLENGQINNLAMPVWNWVKLYKNILDSMMNGNWETESQRNGDRPLSYYAGMNTGAIDLITSKRLPVGVSRLSHLLKDVVTSGQLKPFNEALTDQSGRERSPAGEEPDFKEIVSMRYLLDNVEGYIPTLEQMAPPAQRLVKTHGLHILDELTGTDKRN